MVTIKEIARLAGVSTATVSNVIHGNKSKVSPETFERIAGLLAKHSYVEKMGLRHLNKGRSQIICLTINSPKVYEHTVFADPFYGQILGTVERLFHEKNYYVMIFVSPDSNEIFRTVAAWNIDGIIAVSFNAADCDRLHALTGKPVVSIDVMGKATSRFVNVGLDDFEGGYRMTEYLIKSGYDDIRIFTNDDSGVDHERWRGYRQALDEGGIPYNESRYMIIHTNRGIRIRQYEQLLPLLKKWSALFFLSDFYAIECIGFLYEKNISVPRDVAVAGFDDSIYAQTCVPRLTTVRQDVNGKAAQAVEQLLVMMDGGTIRLQDIRLPVELVIRESVAKTEV